jgi:uncharacterized protein (DUF433 family)
MTTSDEAIYEDPVLRPRCLSPVRGTPTAVEACGDPPVPPPGEGRRMEIVMATAPKLAFEYIVKKPDYCSGKAAIGPTRVRVNNVVFLHKEGRIADEIRVQFPDLTHAQVYGTNAAGPRLSPTPTGDRWPEESRSSRAQKGPGVWPR